MVLLRYDSKARYRLARVVQVHPGPCGVVRTVTIQLRPRHNREKATPYKANQMNEFPVAIQRLVVIVTKEEQAIVSQKEEKEPGDTDGAAVNPDNVGTTAAEARVDGVEGVTISVEIPLSHS